MMPTSAFEAPAAAPRPALGRAHVVTIGVFAILAVAFVAVDHVYGFPPRGGHWVGRDFTNMWVGAKVAAGFDLMPLFDWPRYLATLRTLLEPGFPTQNWSYPPHILLFTWPFGLLDYATGLLVWNVTGVLAYGLAAAALVTARFGRLDGPALALALVAPGVASAIMFGQVGLFAGALFVGGLTLRDRRPIAAGILFGILTVKPQLGALIPILLLLERRWIVIAAAAATAVVLGLLTMALFGPSVFVDYLRLVGPVQGHIMMANPNLEAIMPTPFIAVRRLGLAPELGWIAFALTAPLAVGGLAFAIWRGAERRTVDTLVAAGAFLATPYAFIYDMPVLAPFLAIRLVEAIDAAAAVRAGGVGPDARQRRRAAIGWFVTLAGFSIPYMFFPGTLFALPIEAASVVAVFVMALAEVPRRRTA